MLMGNTAVSKSLRVQEIPACANAGMDLFSDLMEKHVRVSWTDVNVHFKTLLPLCIVQQHCVALEVAFLFSVEIAQTQ